MKENNFAYEKQDLPSVLGKFGYLLLLIGAVAAILAFVFDPTRASFNSILIFTYLFGLGMCSLFLVGLEYLTDAVWSVGYRRIAEYLAVLIVVSPIFAIPVFFNMHDVFHWTHEHAIATDEILAKKTPYLNFQFFFIRFIGIILVMGIFLFIITRNSGKQDLNGDQRLTKKNIRWSAAMMPFLGISTTIIAIDWIMSLEPHWFSTIFGVYYFSGSLLATFAVITLFAIKLKEWKILPDFIGKDHFYNLGAFMFAFINFWAYIAFSQFLLIWYANIPEETFWFLLKFEGSWKYVSIGLIFIQFLIPYAALVSQPSKSSYKRLKIMSIWLIFAHLYDLYWLAIPTYHKEGAILGWIEIGFAILGIGVVITVFRVVYSKRNLIPEKDPKLKRCVDFHL